MRGTSLNRELSRLCGDEATVDIREAHYWRDATEHQGFYGRPGAIVRPASEADISRLLAWCNGHAVTVVPRGGGTGFTGGAVPVGGEVVLSLERLDTVLALDPGVWRMRVEAGVRTATVRRLARENGLLFPPDPGAAEDSMIGGNIATNAGGPHAFKYGVTGAWVTGLRAVLADGEVIEVGGPVRKDVAGYDIRSLLIGSEGTLGVITSAWLRLIPAPAASRPIAAAYEDIEAGIAALEAVLISGVVPAALEYLDGGSIAATAGAYPGLLPQASGFLVVTEADGSEAEAEAVLGELREALEPGALMVDAPAERAELDALWRWRDGVSIGIAAQRGGKVSEDICVPFEHLGEAISATLDIGRAHGLEACSWGHAGDGNLHSTFLIDPRDAKEVERAHAAAQELFALAVRLGGSVSGEHGLGWVKRGQLEHQWSPATVGVHREIKQLLDPRGILNPGKKT